MRMSSKNIPGVSETQLEEDTNTTMADLPTTEAGLLFGQVRKVRLSQPQFEDMSERLAQ